MAIALQNALLYEQTTSYAEKLEQQVVEINDTKVKIKKSKSMLESVFDGIAEPLIFVDRDFKIKILNKSAANYYQVDLKGAIGKHCFSEGKGRLDVCEDCQVKAIITGGRQVTFERNGCMDPDRFEKVTVYPARDIETNSFGAIVRISDITEAKLLQKMVAQSEKLSALGLLVSGIAHEINSPNNFITFNVPVLRDHLEALLSLTDPHILEQVLVNLLINASHALDKQESWIKVKVSFRQPNPIDMTIAVSDNGCGMDEEVQRKVFDPFYTTKEPGIGTGLGLYVCYTLIEGLGGKIELLSECDKGSTFKIVLADVVKEEGINHAIG